MQKFRVWDKKLEKWEDRLSAIYNTGSLVIYNPMTGNWFEPKRSDYEVEWYIGLKDKNGKEIYEGDINEKTGFYVKYNQLHCCFGLFNENGFQEEVIADIYDENGNTPETWKTSAIRVIGNIHDKPLEQS